MIMAFAGEKTGMTATQLIFLHNFLTIAKQHDPWLEFKHTDTIGAAAQAHAIALQLGIPVTIKGPTEDKYRAWCKGATKIEQSTEMEYLSYATVRTCDMLLAAPKTAKEIVRNGPWGFVRRARRIGLPVTVFYPE